MKLFLAVLVYLLIGAILGWAILLAVHGKPLFLIIAFLASVGLPGLASFWSEFFVFAGWFNGLATGPWRALILVPLLSLAITAAYYIWTLQKVVMGEPKANLGHLHDLNEHEKISYTVLLGLILFAGLFPLPFLGMILDYARTLTGLLGVP